MNSEKIIDCQGLPCPQPVLKSKEVIENFHPDQFSIIVDNDPALENVSRYLVHQGYRLGKPVKDGENWIISARIDTDARHEADPQKQKYPSRRNTLVIISRDRIGKGDDELGSRLMQNFLATLPEMSDSLWRIIMLNSGVMLAIDSSPALDSLRELEKKDISLHVCGTCLEFFGLTGRKRIGQTTNMLDIVTAMNMADKIVTL